MLEMRAGEKRRSTNIIFMRKQVLTYITAVFCDRCGKAVPEFYIREKDKDYCTEWCKKEK